MCVLFVFVSHLNCISLICKVYYEACENQSGRGEAEQKESRCVGAVLPLVEQRISLVNHQHLYFYLCLRLYVFVSLLYCISRQSGAKRVLVCGGGCFAISRTKDLSCKFVFVLYLYL